MLKSKRLCNDACAVDTREDARQDRAISPSLPREVEKLFAVAPDRFVTERTALAKMLREEGRKDDADAVAALRKPAVVVFAANRAARDRPKAARAAADAAVAVREAQVGGDADAYAKAVADLDDSLDMLAQVALAHLAKEGTAPTDAMRRRLRDLLRNAAADDEAREDLARGALTGELEVTGFSAYAGVAVTQRPKGRAPATKGPRRAGQAQERRRERVKELRGELAAAERELREATAAARAAERDRVRAEKAVASLRKKLDETR